MTLHKKTFPRQEELTQALKDHGLEHDTPSQLADAFRLGWQAAAITAEPHLLAALQACMPFIDDASDITEFFPESAASNACREAVKQARAAIARALPQGAPDA